MRAVSRLLIRLIGTRLYLRIPQRWRRRLGMVCGEDLSDINDLSRQLQARARSEGQP